MSDSSTNESPIRQKVASRASDERQATRLLCRAFIVAEHLSSIHTALVATRRLTLLQISQNEMLRPSEHAVVMPRQHLQSSALLRYPSDSCVEAHSSALYARKVRGCSVGCASASRLPPPPNLLRDADDRSHKLPFGSNFSAPPLDQPATNSTTGDDDMRLDEAYRAASCRRCALAEAEESLCDFAPRDERWWRNALLRDREHALVVGELASALRLQRLLRLTLSTITCHNACVINVTLLDIAQALSEPAVFKVRQEGSNQDMSCMTTGTSSVASMPHKSHAARDGSIESEAQEVSNPCSTPKSHESYRSAVAQSKNPKRRSHISNSGEPFHDSKAEQRRDCSKDDRAVHHCPVPMLHLCVPPARCCLATESASVNRSLSYGSEYLLSHSGPLLPTPWNMWGKCGCLVPQVARQLAGRVSQLWLSGCMLDQGCRAELMKKWNVASQRVSSIAGTSTAEFPLNKQHLRASMHEILDIYCDQLQDAVRVHSTRVSSAILCASAASLLGEQLAEPLSTLLVTSSLDFETESCMETEGGWESEGAMERKQERFGRNACSMSAAASSSCGFAPLDSCLRACRFRDVHGDPSVFGPIGELLSLRSLPGLLHSVRQEAVESIPGVATSKNQQDASNTDAAANAAVLLLKLVPLLRLRALLRSYATARTDAATDSTVIGSGCTCSHAVGAGHVATCAATESISTPASFLATPWTPLSFARLHPRPSVAPFCLRDVAPISPTAISEVCSYSGEPSRPLHSPSVSTSYIAATETPACSMCRILRTSAAGRNLCAPAPCLLQTVNASSMT